MTLALGAVAPLRFVQLLADEQRWRLLQELARSDRKVSELTELVGKPQNLVSYHLASLRNAGMVSARRSSEIRVFFKWSSGARAPCRAGAPGRRAPRDPNPAGAD